MIDENGSEISAACRVFGDGIENGQRDLTVMNQFRRFIGFGTTKQN